MDKKHAIFLVAEGEDGEELFDLIGLGFSSVKKKIVIEIPKVTASASDKSVKVMITQPKTVLGTAIVKFDYKGVIKTYKVIISQD